MLFSSGFLVIQRHKENDRGRRVHWQNITWKAWATPAFTALDSRRMISVFCFYVHHFSGPNKRKRTTTPPTHPKKKKPHCQQALEYLAQHMEINTSLWHLWSVASHLSKHQQSFDALRNTEEACLRCQGTQGQGRDGMGETELSWRRKKTGPNCSTPPDITTTLSLESIRLSTHPFLLAPESLRLLKQQRENHESHLKLINVSKRGGKSLKKLRSKSTAPSVLLLPSPSALQ